MSGRMASIFLTVSSRVSPLFAMALSDFEMLELSADNRFSASSNESLVRVDSSKKQFMTVLPLSVGTFFIGRSEISLNEDAVCKIVKTSFFVRSFIEIKCLVDRRMCLIRLVDDYFVFAICILKQHFYVLCSCGLYLFSNIISLDRKLTPTAIDHC